MSIFHVAIITAFPQIFPGSLQYSIAGQALNNNIWSYDLINIRDFGTGRHKNIDDAPFGGGNGMVMRPDVLGQAIDYALEKTPGSDIYYMSPRGKSLKQADLLEIKDKNSIIILCGRFEGVDERVIDEYNIQEISIGDFVVSGGELPAMILLDGCIRLLPGVLQNQDTLAEEYFNYYDNIGTLLEYPLYTRPSFWKDRSVPDVLLSGDHGKIRDWRLEEAKKITLKRRPDLLLKNL
jgi:tRNA (guanine37-N1)-methyltransferase